MTRAPMLTAPVDIDRTRQRITNEDRTEEDRMRRKETEQEWDV